MCTYNNNDASACRRRQVVRTQQCTVSKSSRNIITINVSRSFAHSCCLHALVVYKANTPDNSPPVRPRTNRKFPIVSSATNETIATNQIPFAMTRGGGRPQKMFVVTINFYGQTFRSVLRVQSYTYALVDVCFVKNSDIVFYKLFQKQFSMNRIIMSENKNYSRW